MRKRILHSLKLVGVHFLNFFKRLYLFVFFWGRYALVSYIAAILIPICMQTYLGFQHLVSMTIMKVLLTIAPLLPTAAYAECKEEEYEDEFSMDLCFVIWVITIVYAWCIL